MSEGCSGFHSVISVTVRFFNSFALPAIGFFLYSLKKSENEKLKTEKLTAAYNNRWNMEELLFYVFHHPDKISRSTGNCP